MNQEDIEGEIGYFVFCSPFKDSKIFKMEVKKRKYIPVPPLALLAGTLATLRAIRLSARRSRRGRLPLGAS